MAQLLIASSRNVLFDQWEKFLYQLKAPDGEEFLE